MRYVLGRVWSLGLPIITFVPSRPARPRERCRPTEQVVADLQQRGDITERLALGGHQDHDRAAQPDRVLPGPVDPHQLAALLHREGPHEHARATSHPFTSSTRRASSLTRLTSKINYLVNAACRATRRHRGYSAAIEATGSAGRGRGRPCPGLSHQTALPLAERQGRTTQPGPCRNEWAYKQIFRGNKQRQAALAPWIKYYDAQRRHSALGGLPPVSRLPPA
jgi:hypothetical protein